LKPKPRPAASSFNATNAEGHDVKLVVDQRTGTVVSEQPVGEDKM